MNGKKLQFFDLNCYIDFFLLFLLVHHNVRTLSLTKRKVFFLSKRKEVVVCDIFTLQTNDLKHSTSFFTEHLPSIFLYTIFPRCRQLIVFLYRFFFFFSRKRVNFIKKIFALLVFTHS